MLNRSLRNLLVAITLITFAGQAKALPDSASVPVTKVFFNLGNNLGKSFTSNYGLTHLTAIGLTVRIVESGWDRIYDRKGGRSELRGYEEWPQYQKNRYICAAERSKDRLSVLSSC